MLTIHQLFTLNSINPSSVKLIRHGNAEIQILDTFKNNSEKFEAYQSFQTRKKFGNSKAIAVFAPGRGTSAIFLGYWDIISSLESNNYKEKHFDMIEKYYFPVNWKTNTEYYEMIRNPIFNDFSERIVIEWGKSTVSWVQNKDKEIIEIKRMNSIVEFTSYDDIQLSYSDLKTLMKNINTNYTWYSALSSVNGIYLIRDITTGKLYVGSAYGDDGIWGRWQNYSNNGHGGNQELKIINPNNMEFTILEIIPSLSSIDYIIKRENKWKEKLGTRKFGLNKN